jgi:hypothetical protein
VATAVVVTVYRAVAMAVEVVTAAEVVAGNNR